MNMNMMFNIAETLILWLPMPFGFFFPPSLLVEYSGLFRVFYVNYGVSNYIISLKSVNLIVTYLT
jgi:hypothetical protein